MLVVFDTMHFKLMDLFFGDPSLMFQIGTVRSISGYDSSCTLSFPSPKVGSKLNEITRARDDKLNAFMVLSRTQVRNWECAFEVSSVVSRQARASRRSYYDLNST